MKGKENTKCLFDEKYLSIFYENLDGISKHKMNDLLSSTSSADYKVIMASESWLDHTINSLEFMSTKYIVYRKDRESSAISAKRGGGVFVAVQSYIKTEEYINDQMKDLETIYVKIPSLSGDIYVYLLSLHSIRL